MPSIWVNAVIRILDKETISEKFRTLSLDVVGFGESDLKKFRRYIQGTHGMVLVTGPTEAGKHHDAVRRSRGDSKLGGQDHHHRGSGRVSASRHHSDSCQRKKDLRSHAD
jgi:hypothetical protein